MNKIIVASTNKNKIQEIQNFFVKYNIEIIPQKFLELNSVEETGKTFFENAMLKAKSLCKFNYFPILAEDSGLCVPYLNGIPGLKSSRFDGNNNSSKNNIKKLLDLMLNITNSKNRKAYFYCAIVVILNKNAEPILTEGIVNGIITKTVKKPYNFGYNPIFKIVRYNKTLAELNNNLRIKINHRRHALNNLKNILINKNLLQI